MIVTRSEFDNALARLFPSSALALDTETTGLRAYHFDRLFSIIIADETEQYYFNFNPVEDAKLVLPREWLPKFQPLFAEPNRRWYLHNAKFDLAMLAREGLELAGEIHCTMALARVERNDHLKYGLDACAERIGYAKDDTVKKYIKQHKLYEIEKLPGKKDPDKRPLYARVPLEIIAPYGEKDGRITFDLARHQEKAFAAIVAETPEPLPKITTVVENEKRFTKTCFHIERTGILVDAPYTERALAYEQQRYRSAMQSFADMTGIPFQDSNAVLARAFTQMGEKFPLTEKGNPSFRDEVLSKFTTPVAKIVQEYRDAYKKANTYYQNFLNLRDAAGRIHATMMQGGTGTGRISLNDPNLQNLNKPDEETYQEWEVRRCFIPSPGNYLAMIDYQQVEYRMMLDYAQEQEIIDQVLAGLDVHEAMGQRIGRSRKQAKNINFGLLYGQGAQLLADSLGVELDDAKRIKREYFQALPGVARFIQNVMQTAAIRGYIFNWLGRRSYFPDPDFSYKAPNYLIQGGCADVMKVAMNRIDDLILREGVKTRVVLQVHDELVLDVHPSETDFVLEVKKIMETVYPYKRLPLTCSVEHSWKSLADPEEGLPDGKESGDGVQKSNPTTLTCPA